MTHDTNRQELTAEAGAWLDVTQACAHLGIKDRTLFRRVARGELKRQTLPGRRSEFWVPGAIRHETLPDMPQDEPGASLAVMSQQLALIDHLSELSRQQMAPLLDELAVTRQQLTEQAEEIGRLKAENRAVKLAQLELQKTMDARPWWVRWFGP